MTRFEDAVTICKLLELVVPQYGFHVALTGGFLYRDHSKGRKDIDVILYRIRYRDPNSIQWGEMFEAFKMLEMTHVPTEFIPSLDAVIADPPVWLIKWKWRGHNIDMMFPEAEDGDY